MHAPNNDAPRLPLAKGKTKSPKMAKTKSGRTGSVEAVFPPLLSIKPSLYTFAALAQPMAEFYGIKLEQVLGASRHLAVEHIHVANLGTRAAARIDVYGADNNGHAKADEASALMVRCKCSGIEYMVYWTLLLYAKKRPPFNTHDIPPFTSEMLASHYGISIASAEFVIQKLQEGPNPHIAKDQNGMWRFGDDVLFVASTSPIGRYWLNSWATHLINGRSLSCRTTPFERTVLADSRRRANIVKKLRFTERDGVSPRKLKELEDKAKLKKLHPSRLITVAVSTFFAPHILPGDHCARECDSWSEAVLRNHDENWGFARIYTVEIDKSDLEEVTAAYEDYRKDLDSALVIAEGKAAARKENGDQADFREFRVVSTLLF
jgi:hypothetical protein